MATVTDPEQKLSELRSCIDVIDEQIQRLLNERAALVSEVAQAKLSAGGEVKFYRPEREAQILRHVRERNDGPLPTEEMVRLFREMISACLALEQPLRIAYLGPEGTFTQTAALKQFGLSVQTLPLADIKQVFREVEAESADYGVVPVENSAEGVVNHTLDLLMGLPLKICGEIELRIHHHLMGMMSDMSDIRRIYSHSQSFAQCREWLDTHLPQIERIDVSSNAEAAGLAARETTSAVIGPQTVACIYGLTTLHSNIEDQPDNTTRFLVLGRESLPPSGSDKTTLLVAAHNRPGALHQLLEPLARNGVSMSRVESRPSRQAMWEYIFFLDLDGHQKEKKLLHALAELREQASLFKLLGSYPKAIL